MQQVSPARAELQQSAAGSSAEPAGVAAPSANPRSASGKYVPRWKRDPNAKPEPYRPTRIVSGKNPLQPGEYHGWQIAEKLKAPVNHSFIVRVERTNGPLPSVDSKDTHEQRMEPASVRNAGQEELMVIFNHPGANPPSTEPNVQVIWTRNNVDTVKASLGQAYPYFTYKPFETEGRDNTDRPRMIYVYGGHHRIIAADIAPKEEVLDFVKARGQSQAAKPAGVWQDKLNSTWLKVTLRKCPEEEQSVNPMES